MDIKALFKLSYGIFMLSTKSGDRVNGCITNTCMQVANDPERVAISVLNKNLTCELIKESGVFAVSVLDQTCSFFNIKHFGFQSGRDVDKFADIQMPTDVNGVPYMNWQTSAVISCKVISSQDLGTHTLFIAEVQDAQVLSGNESLTYSYYQEHVKPKPGKPASDRPIVGWRCKICNYIYEGSELPEDYMCPLCGHDKDDFEPIYGD